MSLVLIGVVIGIVCGALGTRLVRVLPRRYGISAAELPESSESRRDAVIVFASAITSGGIALVLAAVTNDSFEHLLFLLVTNALIATSVVVAAAIDLEHLILPNELTLGGAAICVLSSPLRSIGWKGALIGLVVGLAITYVPFALYKKVRGQSGVGLGDAKLTLLSGAWLGWEGALSVLFLGALQSAIASVIMRALNLRYTIPKSVTREIEQLRERAARGDEEARSDLADDPMATTTNAAVSSSLLGTRLPLGPFLALACIEVLFCRRLIVEHVFGWLMR